MENMSFTKKMLITWGFLCFLSLPAWIWGDFSWWLAAAFVWGLLILLASPFVKIMDDAATIAAHRADEIRKMKLKENSENGKS